MFPLIEERIQLLSVIEEGTKTLVEKGVITEEEVPQLIEALQNDPELLVEFLGALARFGSKFAKKVGSKLGGYADKKDAQANLAKAKGLRINSIKAHAANIRSGDRNAKMRSRLNMSDTKSTLAHASSNTPEDPVGNAAARKARKMAIRKKHGLKNFLESMRAMFGKPLNEAKKKKKGNKNGTSKNPLLNPTGGPGIDYKKPQGKLYRRS